MREIVFHNLTRVLEDYGQSIREEYRRQLDAAGTNATNTLRDTLGFWVVERDGVYTLQMALQDYWKYLEYGTRAAVGHQQGKRPPFAPLLRWVQAKPVAPWNDRLRRMPTDKAQRAMAYALVHSIWKKGTQPHYFLTKAMPDEGEVMARLAEAIRTDIENWIKVEFNG